MIANSGVQSSTPTLFTLLAMIASSTVWSYTHTLFTLLAMITYWAVQSSTRNFPMLFFPQTWYNKAHSGSSPNWEAIYDMDLQTLKFEQYWHKIGTSYWYENRIKTKRVYSSSSPCDGWYPVADLGWLSPSRELPKCSLRTKSTNQSEKKT